METATGIHLSVYSFIPSSLMQALSEHLLCVRSLLGASCSGEQDRRTVPVPPNSESRVGDEKFGNCISV